MSSVRVLFLSCLLLTSVAKAAPEGSFGPHVGVGLPFLGQFGANYYFTNDLSISATYNILSVDVDTAKAKLTMPEVMVNYHPFSNGFFLGAGLGQESLDVSATDSVSGNQARVEVEALTGILKTGWIWGADNGGFWFGMDIAYIMPMSPKTTITAPGVATTSQEYLDVVEAADKFGETAFLNITLIRMGWLF